MMSRGEARQLTGKVMLDYARGRLSDQAHRMLRAEFAFCKWTDRLPLEEAMFWLSVYKGLDRRMRGLAITREVYRFLDDLERGL